MRKIIFLLVLAAACSDQPQQDPGPPPDTVGGRPDISRPDAGARVQVVISDTAITLSEDSVAMVGAGQITFMVENHSTASETFKIEGNQQGEWSSPLAAGQTIMITALLGRGVYEMLWPEDGSGRKHTFTVY